MTTTARRNSRQLSYYANTTAVGVISPLGAVAGELHPRGNYVGRTWSVRQATSWIQCIERLKAIAVLIRLHAFSARP